MKQCHDIANGSSGEHKASVWPENQGGFGVGTLEMAFVEYGSRL